MPSAVDSAWLAPFHAAYTRFETTVSRDDAREFQHTQLKDVWVAVRHAEAQMNARRSLRGLRRIEPFLKGLEQYSSVLGVLCNGTPYLPWLWAPVKLFIQIALDHVSAFDKLLDAYKLIGVLDRPDTFRRSSSLTKRCPGLTSFQPPSNKQDGAFRDVVGQFYANVIDFHIKAYKYLRRRSWKIFFESSWRTFDSHFKSILESLRKHQELVDREAHTLDIVEAQNFRSTQIETIRQWEADRALRLEKLEREQQKQAVLDAIDWIGTARDQDEEYQDRLLGTVENDNDLWITSTPIIKSWFQDSKSHSLVWLNGKPGAGKSVICSQLVELIKTNGPLPAVLYCYCNLRSSASDVKRSVLQSLAAQLLTYNTDLAPLIVDQYASQGISPSSKSLKDILRLLLSSAASTRILVDGVDELESIDDQAEVLDALVHLSIVGPNAKVLVSCRNLPSISRRLQHASSFCIDEFPEQLQCSIERFLEIKSSSIEQRFGEALALQVKQTLGKRANGMFLWVKLVHEIIQRSYTALDVVDTLESLPRDLETLYARIINLICGDGTRPDQRLATRILQWLAAARRPLKVSELQSGVVFDESTRRLDDDTRIRGNILELCSPLVDMTSARTGTISLIHFTVLGYLRHDCKIPQMQPLQANFTMLYAVVVYLRSAFSLVDSAVSRKEKSFQIVSQAHDLQNYANENIDYHLKVHYDRQTTIDSDDRQEKLLGEAIVHLAAYRDHIALRREDDRNLEHQNRGDHLQLLSRIRAPPQAINFVSDLLYFRSSPHKPALQSKTTSSTVSQLPQDLTLLSEVKEVYDEIIKQLLFNGDDYSELDDHLVTTFKARHDSCAYPCRYANCDKALVGFGNAASRDEHELCHKKTFRCVESGCPQREWLFANGKALRLHIRKYHALTAPTPMHGPWIWNESTSVVRPLEQIRELPHLYRIHGHDWTTIARTVSTALDPKGVDEIERFYYERYNDMQRLPHGAIASRDQQSVSRKRRVSQSLKASNQPREDRGLSSQAPETRPPAPTPSIPIDPHPPNVLSDPSSLEASRSLQPQAPPMLNPTKSAIEDYNRYIYSQFGKFPNPQGSALADYQMQLMLDEQADKRRLLMARQEQEDGNREPPSKSTQPAASPQDDVTISGTMPMSSDSYTDTHPSRASHLAAVSPPDFKDLDLYGYPAELKDTQPPSGTAPRMDEVELSRGREDTDGLPQSTSPSHDGWSGQLGAGMGQQGVTPYVTQKMWEDAVARGASQLASEQKNMEPQMVPIVPFDFAQSMSKAQREEYNRHLRVLEQQNKRGLEMVRREMARRDKLQGGKSQRSPMDPISPPRVGMPYPDPESGQGGSLADYRSQMEQHRLRQGLKLRGSPMGSVSQPSLGKPNGDPNSEQGESISGYQAIMAEQQSKQRRELARRQDHFGPWPSEAHLDGLRPAQPTHPGTAPYMQYPQNYETQSLLTPWRNGQGQEMMPQAGPWSGSPEADESLRYPTLDPGKFRQKDSPWPSMLPRSYNEQLETAPATTSQKQQSDRFVKHSAFREGASPEDSPQDQGIAPHLLDSTVDQSSPYAFTDSIIWGDAGEPGGVHGINSVSGTGQY